MSASSTLAGRTNSSSTVRTTKTIGSARARSSVWLTPASAQEVGPAALAIAQVVGVVDDARGVGVLVVDPHRQPVLAAVEAAGVGFVAIHPASVAEPTAGVNDRVDLSQS